MVEKIKININTIVTAEIDVSTSIGRRIIKDLSQHKRSVKLTYPALETTTGKPIRIRKYEIWLKNG